MAKTQTQWGQPANYNATAPTLNDGDPSAFNVDVNGNNKVTLATKLDKTNDSITAYPQGTTYTQIAASTLIVTGAGQLHGIFVTAASATPTIKVWDSTAGSGTVLIDVFTPTAATYYNLGDAAFTTGCYVTISGTVSCTVFTE